jgi:hypothetical protein
MALFMCRPADDAGRTPWNLSRVGRTTVAKKLLELPETAKS